MSEQQSQVVQTQTSTTGEPPKWGELPQPERISELEARLAAWEQLNTAAREDVATGERYGPFQLTGPGAWKGGALTGADVFYLAARALAGMPGLYDGLAGLSAIAPAAGLLSTASPRMRLNRNLSALHLEGAFLDGAHLGGAVLRGAHLERADLSEAHLEDADLREVHLEGAILHWTHLERADLSEAHLEDADLSGAHLMVTKLSEAHLEGARLISTYLERAALDRADLKGAVLGLAHLEGASLQEANLEGADLINAWMDKATVLNDVALDLASLDQVSFDGANLAVVKWESVVMLGDEMAARNAREAGGKRKDRRTRLTDYEAAVRAHLQLSAVLRNQGMRDQADRFSYRAQVLQRGALRYRNRFGVALGSRFLDLISGYGYRPWRSFITYALVVLAFAAAYFTLGGANGQSLSWNEAIVISMTAFHGRGFFSAVFQPGDLQAAVAAVEAFIGLLIEIVFIATFTNRFFAR